MMSESVGISSGSYDPRQRERRRLMRIFAPLGPIFVALTVASGGVHIGYGLLGCFAVYVMVLGVGELVVRRSRAKRFVVDGAMRQGWPADVPLAVLRTTHAKPSARDFGEIVGHLFVLDDALVWRPRKPRQVAFEQLRWDHTWRADLQRIWGPGQQGHLTLTASDGREMHLWVWMRKSLASALHQ